MNNRKTSVAHVYFRPTSADTSGSTRTQKRHTLVCSSATRTTPKSYSNSDGCTISRAQASAVKSRPLSTSKSLLIPVSTPLGRPPKHMSDAVQIKPTHRAGTCLADVTCHSRNTQKPTKPINKPSTVTAETRRSGAQSECSTIRSISTETRWMHIPVRSD